MKKILLTLLALLNIAFFCQASHAALIEYGALGKIKSISKANAPQLKTGDQVYIHFKIDPLNKALFGDKTFAQYNYSVTIADLWIFKTSIFNSYHSAVYNINNDIAKIINDETLIQTSYDSKSKEIKHDLTQRVFSSKSLTNSNYRASNLDLNITTILDQDPSQILPSFFKLSEAEEKKVMIVFRNVNNALDFFFVQVDINMIVYDNPNSLNDTLD